MKKFFSMFMVVIMFFGIYGQVVQGAFVASAEETDYIVVTDSPYAATRLAHDFDGEVLELDKTICSITANSYEAVELNQENEVIYIEEDITFTASSETETTFELDQWYLDAIAIDENTATNKVKVEILDSGVDYSGDFSVKSNINLVPDGNESAIFRDSTGHGTAIAGIIGAAENDSGITGINPSVELYSVKVLDSTNQSPLSRIVDGIYWGIENDMDIINMSFGTDIDSDILHNAIIEAHNAGILLIAAAGNTEHQSVQYPAAYNEVIGVGSVDASGKLAELTSIDGNLDILAPGENILTTTFLNTVSTLSGTSMATAQVTGVASLLWAKDTTKTNEFIKQLICSTVNKPETLDGVDAGIVNYAAAIAAYDEFSSTYQQPNATDTDFSVNEGFNYSEKSSLTVEGLWMNSSLGHYGLSETATTLAGFAGNAPDIVRYACTKLDGINSVQYKNYKSGLEHHYAGAPHGIGNYVINLRFLYLAARTVYDNGVGAEYNNLVSAFKNNNNYWTVDWRPKDPNYDKTRFNALVNQVNYFLETKELMIENIKNNFDNYSEDAQNRYLGCMIFGMALHLAGDMYAHRTIVPTYTIVGVNYDENTKIDNGRYLFGGKYFNILAPEDVYDNDDYRQAIKDLCYSDAPNPNGSDNYLLYWQYFQRGVALQVMEFRDIKMFLKEGVSNVFEDNANFSAERYYAAELSCVRLAKRFKIAGTFYTKLIYPKNFDEGADNAPYQYVKLNNFKKYTIASGLDYLGVALDESDWTINSNTILV